MTTDEVLGEIIDALAGDAQISSKPLDDENDYHNPKDGKTGTVYRNKVNQRLFRIRVIEKNLKGNLEEIDYYFAILSANFANKNYRIDHTKFGSRTDNAIRRVIFDKMAECMKDEHKKFFMICGLRQYELTKNTGKDYTVDKIDYCIFIEPTFADYQDVDKIAEKLFPLGGSGNCNIPIYTEAEKDFFEQKILPQQLNRTFRFGKLDGSFPSYIALVPVPKLPTGTRDVQYLRQYLFAADSRPYSHYVRYVPMPVAGQASNATPGKGWPRNFIISGAPGTGKSYTLNKHVEEEVGEDYDDYCARNYVTRTYLNGKIKVPVYEWNDHVRRVTFYEDYSYENFVGCYKPQPDPDHTISLHTDNITTGSNVTVNGINGSMTSTEITYAYQPGPFIDTYVEAKNNPDRKYFLIIEEINRARAASVFGDIFQLLDRDSSGESTYSITPEPDLAEYLQEKGLSGEMKIPSNMYIWATMNNADQGVNPLDSAFKRRWGYLYMGIDSSVNNIQLQNSRLGKNQNGPVLCEGKYANGDPRGVDWNRFRTALNRKLLKEGVSEDKCIGPYYFSEEEFLQIENYYLESDQSKRSTMVNPLRDKLLLYLFTDVCRNNPGLLFGDDVNSMSDIRRKVN